MIDRRRLLQTLVGGGAGLGVLATPTSMQAAGLPAQPVSPPKESFRQWTDRLVQEMASELAQREIQNRPVLRYVPVRLCDETMLVWESHVPDTQDGTSCFIRHADVYGEYLVLQNEELTQTRNDPTAWNCLLYEKLSLLIRRRFDRIESEIWNSLLNGCCDLPLDTESRKRLLHFYKTQTNPEGRFLPEKHFLSDLAASSAWAPEDVNQTMAMMNQTTFERWCEYFLLKEYTQRPEPFPGARLDLLNAILMQKRLPRVVVYDHGYVDDPETEAMTETKHGVGFSWMGQCKRGLSGQSVQLPADIDILQQGHALTPRKRYVPDGIAVVFAKTDEKPMGNYHITRNANNPDLAPGSYTRVVDSGEMTCPRTVDIHDGHNGGVVLYRPGDSFVLQV